ncbi:hypothetical protein [Alistipes sp.]|uniref:hypothetical protein n=1 Tax=Alistipes sp. TaxID=1872444 RepID=UPI003AB2F5B6
MKKFYSLCVLLCVIGASSCLISSCSSDDEGDTPPALPGNSFVYGDTEHKIESVVYAVDETGKIYSFYFSPTPGLVDLDAMLIADDYIRIVTNTPTGEIDLLASGNQLLYKKLNISSATGDNVQKAVLTLQLTSLTTAKMSLDATTKDGATLRAEYNGLCIKQGGGQEGPTYDVTLTSQIFGYYMGPKEGADTNEYYMALTNAEFQATGGTQFTLSSAGYVLMLDFYGATGENWKDMPTGTFSESKNFEDHTYFSSYSFISYYDDNGQRTDYQIADDVKIERDEAGNATVTATYLDARYEEHKIIYTGELKMGNATLNVHVPMVERDMVIDGAYASGIYGGDVLDNGSGLVEITIIDQKGESDEPNGSALHITLSSTKFTNPKTERALTPGTYTAATNYAQGTWTPAFEVEIMPGQFVTMGTFALYDNGTQQGQYSYAVAGDIVIREGDRKNYYTIEYELQSVDGYKISGSYTGEVFLEDQSNDEKNDGSSTLESDYEMNLGYLKRADCYPQDQIWVPALGGNIPVSSIPDINPPGKACGYQFFQIGTTAGTWEITDEYPLGGGRDGKGKGKLVEGDIIGIELLVAEGTEDKITPGVYPVTPNRYPAQFRPGVCVRGYTGKGGTTWQFIASAIGWGYPDGYFDPEYMVANGWLNVPTANKFASIYGGSITVSKAEGGDNWYTFKIDGIDVVKHKVTGSWTGPVYLGGTDTPIQQSGTAVQAVVKQRALSLREVKSHIADQQSVLPKRHTYNK